MFGTVLIVSFAWLCANIVSAEIPSSLATFVRRAVPTGEIRYWSSFAATHSTYHVFTLHQAERRGVLVVRQTAQRGFEVVGADTSFDSFPKEAISPESVAVVEAAIRLLNGKRDDSCVSRVAASAEDICPLGASLNALLIPITGFALTSNGTFGILRDLQHANAYPVEPKQAPPGSILVCPSQFSAEGPVTVGFAVIVGPDRCVYGPDYRLDGAWHRLATLPEWLQANQAVSDIRGFLLQAKGSNQTHDQPPKPSSPPPK